MKKILSVFLAVIISVLAVVPCFAADGKCNCGDAPIIYVAALGSGTLTLDEGTENERVLFRPDIADLLPDIMPIVPAAAKLIGDGDYDAFGDVLVDVVNAAFGELALDENGNSSERVTCEEFVPENDEHGIGHSYYFGYDFRLDPVENAKGLREYVQQVKELTGHDTVKFRASSMGGVVTMSYIRLYGTDDVETIIFQCCPLLGTAVAGELFNGLVYIDKETLLGYAKQATPELENDFLAGVLYALVEVLETAGLFDALLPIADELIANLKDRVFEDCLIPIFATMPGIWSFVPDEYYETGKEFMRLDNSVNAALLEKIDFYHYEVQQNAGELLNKAKASGTTVYNVVGYNMYRTPLVTAYTETSDGTVDTKYASLGATCAPIGEQLPSDYTQAKYPEKNYISPDRMIDASTSLLPESTWFVKDMMHSSTHDAHGVLYDIMFESEEQLTVFDMQDYPQFLQNDTANQTLTPVESEGTLLDQIKNLTESFSFYAFAKLIFKIFDSILAMF